MPVLSPLPLTDAELDGFRLRARRLAATSGSGAHRRRRAGQSLEFRDYRAYVLGDDIRAVDWPASRRLGGRGPGDWTVRTFEAEERLTVVVCPDLRPSLFLPAAAPKIFVLLWTLEAVARLVARAGDRLVIKPLAGDRVGPISGSGDGAVEAALRFRDAVLGAWPRREADWQAEPAFRHESLLAALPPTALVIVLTDLLLDERTAEDHAVFLRAAQGRYRQVLSLVLDSWPFEAARLAGGPVRLDGIEGIVVPDHPLEADAAARVEIGRQIEAIRIRIQDMAAAGGLQTDLWSWPKGPIPDLAEAFRGWFLESRPLRLALGGGE